VIDGLDAASLPIPGGRLSVVTNCPVQEIGGLLVTDSRTDPVGHNLDPVNVDEMITTS
jgi:hypothetical protein